MSKAIEKALEEFPIVGDLHLRNAYISGYHQAEKDLADAFQAEYAKELARADLALTWEDLQTINDLFYQVDAENGEAWDYEVIEQDLPFPYGQKFYEEVLRRFRETKNK